MSDPRIIEKQCQLIDTETNEALTFQMMPDGISDSKSVNWNNIEIIGRSHPVLGFASSGARTISLPLTFFALNGGGIGPHRTEDQTSIDTVSKNLKFLLSLAYPDYSKGVMPPHRCVLVLGEQVNMICVVADVNITYRSLWKDGKPVYAEASVTLIEADPYPITYSKIRG